MRAPDTTKSKIRGLECDLVLNKFNYKIHTKLGIFMILVDFVMCTNAFMSCLYSCNLIEYYKCLDIMCVQCVLIIRKRFFMLKNFYVLKSCSNLSRLIHL